MAVMSRKYSADDKRRFFEWTSRFLSLCSAESIVVPEKMMFGGGSDRLVEWIVRALEKAETLSARALQKSDLKELLRVLGEGYGFFDFLAGSPQRKQADDRSSTVIGRWIAYEKKRMHYWLTIGPREFETEVARLLENDGMKTEVTTYSADGGVDIWAWQDARAKMAVQCKRYTNAKAGVGEVRELVGAMRVSDSEVGLIVCTNGFTTGAIKLALENNIILWGLDDILKRAQKV